VAVIGERTANILKFQILYPKILIYGAGTTQGLNGLDADNAGGCGVVMFTVPDGTKKEVRSP
jgi:hypothetical protein